MNLLNFFLALLPILWLIIAMSILKMPGYRACLIALVITAALAIFYWRLAPVSTGTAILEGVLNALWPIIIVIIAALFTYNLTLKTGAMDTIKAMLGSVSTDKRVLMLIIAWGFGNFMEGMAGFGTAVAIPAGILVGLGFDPLLSIVSCLVINSTPTAFGSVGVPATTMSNITGLPVLNICSSTAIMQMLLTFLAPFLGVIIIGKGVKALKGLIPFLLLATISFIVPQYLAAAFIGSELPDILGAIISMVVMIVAAKLLPPKTPAEFVVEDDGANAPKLTFGSAVKAWSPFILIFVFLLFSSPLFPFIHDPLASIKTSVAVFRGENPATLTFYWINTPGVLILLAGFIGGLIQGASFKEMFVVLGTTIKKNVKTIVTICSVLAVAKIMGYSGMTSDIASVLVALTGSLFPLISPIIGVIGGFVTGSGTSTTVLFGSLQVQTAEAIGTNPVWLAAANLVGAGIGKMVCPQSIAIGTAAVGLVGSESKVLSKVAIFCLIFAVLAGIFCFTLPLFGIGA